MQTRLVLVSTGVSIMHPESHEHRRAPPDDLRGIVQRHRVFFEVVPAREVTEQGIRPVGYDLRVYGTHEGGSRGAAPGCERCLEVWRDLRELGRGVIPSDRGRTSRYGIRPFDSALRSDSVVDSQDRNREDVLLVIEIRHEKDFFAPIDPCEDQCVKEMIGTLKALGAKEGHWASTRA